MKCLRFSRSFQHLRFIQFNNTFLFLETSLACFFFYNFFHNFFIFLKFKKILKKKKEEEKVRKIVTEKML